MADLEKQSTVSRKANIEARKHRYGKNPTVPVPGTSWVRILPRCMRTPGVPVFGQKKKFPVRFWYGSGRVRYGAKPKRRRFRLKTEALFSFSATPITAGKLGSLSSALCLTSSTAGARFSLLCSLSLTSSTAGKLGSLSSALCLSLPPPSVLGSLSSALCLSLPLPVLCSLSLSSFNLPI